MADKQITELDAATALVDADILPVVVDIATTAVTKKITWQNVLASIASEFNGIYALPEGWLGNGKIVPSVASNNLTLEIKTLADADPSASDPVAIRINNTAHVITSALSVTLAAGTKWFNLGSEHAAQDVDFFAYVGYNATDGVTLGFARVPYGRLYSDFSTTSTAETYCAISTITNAAAGDEYCVVGRFNASLSAGASYNWSIPATAIVLQRPTFETRLLTWVPTFGGFSSAPTAGVYNYSISGRRITLSFYQINSGTSNLTTYTITAPVAAAASPSTLYSTVGIGIKDNSNPKDTSGLLTLASGASTINCYTNTNPDAAGAWTNANLKRVQAGTLIYYF